MSPNEGHGPTQPWGATKAAQALAQEDNAFALEFDALAAKRGEQGPIVPGHAMHRETIPAGENPKDRMGAAKIPTLSVVPASSLLALGNVMRLGAEKYGRFNWREKAVRTSVYADAAMRHLMSFMDGEDVDPESGETHLAHVMACMSIVIDARARGVLQDDRSNPGADMGYQLQGTAAELIRNSVRIVH